MAVVVVAYSFLDAFCKHTKKSAVFQNYRTNLVYAHSTSMLQINEIIAAVKTIASTKLNRIEKSKNETKQNETV